MKPPIVDISTGSNESEGYIYQDRRWSTNDLIKAAEGLQVFSVPIASIDLSTMPWDIDSVGKFVFHFMRVTETDLKYPIILDSCGAICNGWHRVAKAVLEGKREIKAVRLVNMPRSEEVST